VIILIYFKRDKSSWIVVINGLTHTSHLR